jgi:hypothetical protein
VEEKPVDVFDSPGETGSWSRGVEHRSGASFKSPGVIYASGS